MNKVEKGIDLYNKFRGNTAKMKDCFTNVFKRYWNKTGRLKLLILSRLYTKKKQQKMGHVNYDRLWYNYLIIQGQS